MHFSQFVHTIEDWIQCHPQWLFIFILITSCAESLAIVGIIVPGIVLLMTAGALAGKGDLPIYLALIAAGSGAFIGDTLSFLIGNFFIRYFKNCKFLQKHQQWIQKGQLFFAKHGTVSVLIARFAGPLRAIIPMIAGMSNMSKIHFVSIACIAGILWSPCYILPGYLIGVSMQWTEFISFGFLTNLLIIIVVSWLFTFSYFKYIKPSCKSRFPLFLIIFTAFILLILAVKLQLLHDFDYKLAFSILHEETFLIRKIAHMVTMLGSYFNISLWSLILFIFLWQENNKKNALIYIISFASLGFTIFLLKHGLDVTRPPNIHREHHYSFPSGHTALITFFGLVFARHLVTYFKPKFHFIIFGLAVFMSLIMALARMFLNMHWASDVIGGILLGYLAYNFWIWLEYIMRSDFVAVKKITRLIFIFLFASAIFYFIGWLIIKHYLINI